MINKNRSFCYRITHRDNLDHILEYGIVHKNHEHAYPRFISIGNPEIIDVRTDTKVNLQGYGNIGEYIPFYFTPRSIMLLNIVSGYWVPKVPQRSKEEIIVIRCLIETLSEQQRWFFTDGQANDEETNHYCDLKNLDRIDWDNIQYSRFSKSDGDIDRPRRYQAEFLVHGSVPVNAIESICVYSDKMKHWAQHKVNEAGKMIPVYVHKPYFFD